MLLRWSPIAALAAAVATTPALAREGNLPIQLSPTLGIERIADIPAMLARPFHRPTAVHRPGQPELRGEVVNCNALFEALAEGFTGDVAATPIAECRALAWLAGATPAAESFVRDFVLDEFAPSVLPAAMVHLPNCREMVRLVRAEKDGQSWQALDRIFYRFDEGDMVPVGRAGRYAWLYPGEFFIDTDPARIARAGARHFLTGAPLQAGAERARYYGLYTTNDIEVIARADLNGDGVEDLLIQSDVRMTFGGAEWRRALALTRGGPAAVFRLLDPVGVIARGCDPTDWRAALYYKELPEVYPSEAWRPHAGPRPRERAATVPPPAGRVRTEGPFPVWLSPWLGIERAEDATALLDRPFYRHPDWKKLELGGPADLPPREATTCNELFNAIADGYSLEGAYWRADDCLIFARLPKARPARTSYVRDFKLDENAPRYLPAAFTYTVNCDMRSRVYLADREGVNWPSFLRSVFSSDDGYMVPVDDDGSEVLLRWGEYYVVTDPDKLWRHGGHDFLTGEPRTLGPERAEFYDLGTTQKTQILARADFNDDGLEDLLIFTDQKDTFGRLGGDEVLVLTRDRPDAVLRIVDVANYVARGCEKDSWESYPELEDLPAYPSNPWRP